jgi:hypothetical protein
VAKKSSCDYYHTMWNTCGLYWQHSKQLLPVYLINSLHLLIHIVETETKESSWMVDYILLMWLIMLCKNPFELARFSGHDTVPLIERIRRIAVHFLNSPSRARLMAGELIAQLTGLLTIEGSCVGNIDIYCSTTRCANYITINND